MQRDSAFLIDIIHAAENAQRFVSKMDKKQFLENSLVQSGVMHQIIIIGEAVKRLSMNLGQITPKFLGN